MKPKIKLEQSDYPNYAFMRVHGQPYITSIVNWTMKDCKAETVKQMGMDWKAIYKDGGRIVKIKMSLI